MTLKKYADGDVLTGSQLNGTNGEHLTLTGLNTIRQLIDRAGVWSAGQIDGWGDAYIDANGRENSVDTTNSVAEFDTNKYKVRVLPTMYVEIVATSLTPSDFLINDCQVLVHPDGGRWLLYCDTGTDNVKKAQIIKTLFFGTNGTDERASSTYITGLTALKSHSSTDTNKRALKFCFSMVNSGTANNVVLTFSDTSTNTNCNSWSNCYSSLSNGIGIGWHLPSGTLLNSADSSTSNEIGTDRTADDASNPASCKWAVVNGGTGGASGTAIILCNGGGTITDNTDGNGSYTYLDFYSDNSIPLLTDGSSLDLSGYIKTLIHDIPAGTFSGTISKAIGVPLIEDWETGADIQYKLTNATEDTGWLSCGIVPEIGTFTAFTSEPTKLTVKLTPKTTSPTAGYPSIKGFWVMAG